MTATAITSLGEDTEVTEKAKRRSFTVEYKRRIGKEPTPARRRSTLEFCVGARGCRSWRRGERQGPGLTCLALFGPSEAEVTFAVENNSVVW